jgi:hypothetical protein
MITVLNRPQYQWNRKVIAKPNVDGARLLTNHLAAR